MKPIARNFRDKASRNRSLSWLGSLSSCTSGGSCLCVVTTVCYTINCHQTLWYRCRKKRLASCGFHFCVPWQAECVTCLLVQDSTSRFMYLHQLKRFSTHFAIVVQVNVSTVQSAVIASWIPMCPRDTVYRRS